jgi:hypothetical protein
MMIDPHVIRSRREGSPYRPATGRDSDVTDIYMPARCFDGNQALVITERRRLVRPAPNSWPRPKRSPFFWLFFGGGRILLCNCNATMQGQIPVAVCGGARSLPVSATASA